MHSRDLLLVFSAALVLQNPKLSVGGGGVGWFVYSFHIVYVHFFLMLEKINVHWFY
jgi:hypothetical protein